MRTNHLHREGSKIVRGDQVLGSKEREDVLVSNEGEMSSCSKERNGFTNVEEQGDRVWDDEGDVARVELVDEVFVEHIVKPNVLVDPDARALVMFQGALANKSKGIPVLSKSSEKEVNAIVQQVYEEVAEDYFSRTVDEVVSDFVLLGSLFRLQCSN